MTAQWTLQPDLSERSAKPMGTVGDAKADEVGDLFFHTIGVPCFNFEYGEYCKDKSSFLFCSKGYELGDTVTLNYVLSDIWYRDETRARLP